MNKCKLIKPVPTIGRVLPIGLVIDAPDAYKNRLVANGMAVWVDEVQAQKRSRGRRPPAPNYATKKKRAGRKKVR